MQRKTRNIIILVILLCIGIFAFYFFNQKSNEQYIPYDLFLENVNDGEIKDITIYDDKVIITSFNENDEVKGEVYLKNKNEEIKSGKVYFTDNPKSNDFKEKMLISGISVKEDSTEENIEQIFDIFFYLFFFGVFGFLIYKVTSELNKDFKVVRHTKVNFSDIAGMDEVKKEMIKIVEILKNSKKYNEKGIRQVKGIILEGPPGNGKTLFAKALANEAKVNFIATKGADFQSALMSMGSRKIKALFKKAKKCKPCIIFIDEFDSIGERRNYAGTGVDKENNRIITSMLNEMDGFDSQDGILVIAATNSYASLDAALIRPGRFDIKYNISNPDYKTRLELIEIYTKTKKLASNISKEKLAEAFEMQSCAGIETILNEASTLALIDERKEIELSDIINASHKTNCKINERKLN